MQGLHTCIYMYTCQCPIASTGAQLPFHHHRGPASPAASLPLQALGRCTPAPRPLPPPDGKPNQAKPPCMLLNGLPSAPGPIGQPQQTATQSSLTCMLLYVTPWVPLVSQGRKERPKMPLPCQPRPLHLLPPLASQATPHGPRTQPLALGCLCVHAARSRYSPYARVATPLAPRRIAP